MITGRLMEDGRLIGGHLMEVQLYTEYDNNHVCIINQWKGGEEILHDHEKILCDLKDRRQHGLIKKTHIDGFHGDVIRLQSQKSQVLRILIYTRLKINRK